MRNSDKFYEVSLNFQNQRKLTVDKFEKTMKAIEDAQGSRYYEERKKQATEERDNALKSLKANYLSEIKSIFADMRKVNSARKMQPPTEQELAILNGLKLREHLSYDDVVAAANSLCDSRFCLSVLDEIARKNNVFGVDVMSYAKNDTYTVSEVESIIRATEKNLKDFVEFDTADAARRVANARSEHYGNSYTLPKRPLFESKEQCFISLCGLSESNWMDFEFAIDEHERG